MDTVSAVKGLLMSTHGVLAVRNPRRGLVIVHAMNELVSVAVAKILHAKEFDCKVQIVISQELADIGV